MIIKVTQHGPDDFEAALDDPQLLSIKPASPRDCDYSGAYPRGVIGTGPTAVDALKSFSSSLGFYLSVGPAENLAKLGSGKHSEPTITGDATIEDFRKAIGLNF